MKLTNNTANNSPLREYSKTPNREGAHMNTLELVKFMSFGEDEDLIISFFVSEVKYPSVGYSLTLMRNMKFEFLQDDFEIGVTVSDEREDDGTGRDPLLKRIKIGKATATVWTDRKRHDLNLRDVEKRDIKEAKKVLKKMNHDNRFKLEVS